MPTLTKAQLAKMPKKVRDAVETAAKPKPTPYDGMTLTERRYAERLDADPQVIQWWFERDTFTLARNCRYTVDFTVRYRDGRRWRIEYHEVKGEHVWDDSIVKFKVAAERFRPWRFAWCQWKNGAWKISYYKPLGSGHYKSFGKR